MAALVKEATKWCEMLDKNPGEEWLKRVAALRGLRKMIEQQSDAANDPDVWTKELFIVLRLPIQRQIKDLRSGITKEVGEMMTALSINAQDAAGPFFADQWVTILEGLSGGNKVIFGHIDVCMKQVIPNTRIKKSIERLCKEAKNSKSNQLREFCAEYLYLMLASWDRDFLVKDADNIASTIQKCLLDASPAVRASIRSAFFEFNNHFPEEGARLLSRTDSRTQKFLEQHVQQQVGSGGGQAMTPRVTGSPRSVGSAAAVSKSFSHPKQQLSRSGSGGSKSSSSLSSSPTSATPSSPSGSAGRKVVGGGKKAAAAAAPPPRVPVEEQVVDGLVVDKDDDDDDDDEQLGDDDEAALPALGARVLADVREGLFKGTVRFAGGTDFAGGEWCGVELDVAQGKNDGSVGGNRYFSCPKNFGLFVRPAQLTIVVGNEEQVRVGGGGGDDALPTPPPRGGASGGSGSGWGLGSMLRGKGSPPAPASAAAETTAGPEEWQALGVDLLHEHKKHIDSVLSQLREEMELLADFERMQERLTKDRVMTYNEAMRVCVEHRDELSSEFRSNVQACYDKYGVNHDNLSIE